MTKPTANPGWTALRGLRRAICAVACCLPACAPADLTRNVEGLDLPPGFSVRVLAQVDGARQIALSPAGTLYVGTGRPGRVWAIPNATTAPGEPLRLLSGLMVPNGVAFHRGKLYVGALSKVLVLDDVEALVARRDTQGRPVVVTDQLPQSRHHGSRYLRFSQDGKLFVSSGAPCNVCEPGDHAGAILEIDPDTGAISVYARGIRNSVGMAVHPETGALWFTDNGRDNLGDDIPPEEINLAARAGQHFGFPYVHANGIRDPEYGDRLGNRPVASPVFTRPAHSAALGLTFYTGDQFPRTYRGGLFIAEHGSWNRSAKVGYQVSFAARTAAGFDVRPFMTGWLTGQSSWGRPVDVIETPDGSLLISDDTGDAIYEVRYAADGD